MIKVQQTTYVDFEDGTLQAARVKFINPKAAPITYEGVFYLAEPANLTVPVNTPVSREFTVAAQSFRNEDYDVQIPLLTVQQKNLVACVQVKVAGTPIVTFVGSKIVRVTFAPSVEWGDIIWL